MNFDDFWCKMKLRACLFRFCCFQHSFALLKTTKTFSEVKSVGFPLPNFQMCSVCNYWSSGCLRPRKYIIHAYNVGIHDKKFFQLLIRLHTHFRLLIPKITRLDPWGHALAVARICCSSRSFSSHTIRNDPITHLRPLQCRRLLLPSFSFPVSGRSCGTFGSSGTGSCMVWLLAAASLISLIA